MFGMHFVDVNSSSFQKSYYESRSTLARTIDGSNDCVGQIASHQCCCHSIQLSTEERMTFAAKQEK